jgi:hypothetical protein
MNKKVRFNAWFIVVCLGFQFLGFSNGVEAKTIWRLQDTTGKKWGIDIDNNVIKTMKSFPLFEESTTGFSVGNENIFLKCKTQINTALGYDAFVDTGLDENLKNSKDMMTFVAGLGKKKRSLTTEHYQRIEKSGQLTNVFTNLLFIKEKWKMNKQVLRVNSIDRIEMINIGSDVDMEKWVAIFHLKIRDSKGWLASEYVAVFKSLARDYYYVVFASPGKW